MYQLELMKQIEQTQMPLHRSELYLSLLQFYREVVNRYTVIVLLQRELNHMLQEPIQSATPVNDSPVTKS